MNDVASLIERLKHSAAVWAAWDTWELNNGPAPEAVNHAEYSRTCDEAAAELSRLSASPLPKEIAGYVTWLEGLAAKGGKAGVDLPNVDARALGRIAAALQQQAREIERLNQGWQTASKFTSDQQARIRELEAERDHQARDAKMVRECNAAVGKRVALLEAERDKLAADASRKCQLVLEEAKRADAIRAKTIEELREPTEQMICVGDEKIIEALQDHTFALRDPTPAKACWRAMFEVAIRALS